MDSKIIVALDFSEEEKALAFIEQLNPSQCALKVGLQMFTLFGRKFVQNLVGRGFKVFLDLKFHDIPNTVSEACKSCAELGVWMLNVHASGGLKMMEAAQRSLEPYGKERPLLIGVTVLTSFNEDDYRAIGYQASLAEQVLILAELTKKAGLNGIVCSALEVPQVKNILGPQFLTITPGIRLLGDETHDQARIITPKEAIQLGSDFLVLGRALTNSPNPANVLDNIHYE